MALRGMLWIGAALSVAYIAYVVASGSPDAPPPPVTATADAPAVAAPQAPAGPKAPKQDLRPQTEARPGPRPAHQPEPQSAQRSEPQPAPQPAQQSQPAADAPPHRPSLDVVRVAPDGDAVFAGVATPGSDVEIRIGEQVIATARAGADGGFVAFGVATPQGEIRRLDLVEVDRDTATARAASPVLIAPPAPPAPDAPVEASPAAPTLVQLRPDGPAMLQAPPLEADQPVSLDLVSYADDGALELSGRAGGLRLVRVYANVVLIAETRAAADGRWSARAAAGLAPGTYVLRVDVLSEDGAVLARTESPFRREDGRLAAAPGEIVVQPGDTLWAIAENRYGSGVRYSVIYQANSARIRDPDLIFPGQIFTAPDLDALR